MADDSPRVWVEEDHRWRVLGPGENHRCRSRGCTAPAVVELRRNARRGLTAFVQRWRYCAEHCYGRRVENGRVMVLVHPQAAAFLAAPMPPTPAMAREWFGKFGHCEECISATGRRLFAFLLAEVDRLQAEKQP